MHNDMLWTITVMVAMGMLGAVAKEIQAWRASKDAPNHPALLRLSGMALDICNSALALMSANPRMTPHDAAAWALSELKASGPGLIEEVGDDASDTALRYMVNRKMITAAQAAPISTVTDKVIAALAPSAATARVTPAQVATVSAAAINAAPIALEDVEGYLLRKFPGLVALTAPPTPIAPPVPPLTEPAPVVPAAA